MKNFKFWLAAIVAVSLVSLTAGAQTASVKKCEPDEHHQHFDGKEGGKGFGPMGHRPFENIHFLEAAGISLTDSQKKMLADAHMAQEPAMRDLHTKIRAAHEALDNADDTNADDAMLTTLSNNVAALMAQQDVARIKMHRQLLSRLTPEQAQKLADFKAEHKNEPHWREKPHAN